MTEPAHVRSVIRDAFRTVEPPPRWALRGSNEGEEPCLLEKELQAIEDWTLLDARYLDGAPGGHASALSFFSDEALRFFLPMYLLADLDGGLARTDLVFHLCSCLGARGSQRINPRRYGARTWLDHARHRFSTFGAEQALALIEYLRWKRESVDLPSDLADVDAAITFWQSRRTELAEDGVLPDDPLDRSGPHR